MESKILQGLNSAQREAVVNYDYPSLIIAGAGSGKTRVLTSRIAYMIEQGVKPYNILALTFTNKAAEQMRTRIEQMVGSRARYIRMGTFHSVFSRILRENAERIGYTDSYTIYEPSDCKNLIKTICKEMNLADDKYKPAKVLSRISFAKNCLVTSGAYAANSVYAAEDRQAQMPHFGDVYAEYCRRCKQNGAMDFDDLLLQTNVLLRDCPDVLRKYQELFHYILVDEYQDTNMAQYVIVRRLALLHSNVCVVGDDAQSIYAFRGAKIENILSFQRDYPTTRVYKLEQNYRSTQTIVEAANSLIKHNSRRLEKRCFSAADKGKKIRLVRVLEDSYEATEVAMDIKDKARDGAEWRDFAILYRTNKQHGLFESALARRGIPYRVYKGMSLLEHKDIRSLLAYIALIINPNDNESFKRVVNYPARGIGDTTVARIEQMSREQGISMWHCVEQLMQSTTLSTVERAVVRKVADFVKLISELAAQRMQMSVCDFAKEVIARSGILHMLEAEKRPENDTSKDYLDQLLAMMSSYEDECHREMDEGLREADYEPTIDEWMQNIMLQTDQDSEDDGNRVTLMTVHSAKGLEYDYIYIVGMEEGLFPSKRSVESLAELEEERRLMYVALTRAKREAMLSFAEMRRVWGKMENALPSRFLREIESEFIDANFNLDELSGRGRFASLGAMNDDDDDEAFVSRAPRYGERRQTTERTAFVRRSTEPQRPRPEVVTTPPPIDPRRAGMRSVGVRQEGNSPAPQVEGCAYRIGERVEHPKFGLGTVERIELLATDHKVVVAFDSYGSKTLLAKFAKLTKV